MTVKNLKSSSAMEARNTVTVMSKCGQDDCIPQIHLFVALEFLDRLIAAFVSCQLRSASATCPRTGLGSSVGGIASRHVIEIIRADRPDKLAGAKMRFVMGWNH